MATKNDPRRFRGRAQIGLGGGDMFGGSELALAEGTGVDDVAPEFKPANPIRNALSFGQGSRAANAANLGVKVDQWQQAQEMKNRIATAAELAGISTDEAVNLATQMLGPKFMERNNLAPGAELSQFVDLSTEAAKAKFNSDMMANKVSAGRNTGILPTAKQLGQATAEAEFNNSGLNATRDGQMMQTFRDDPNLIKRGLVANVAQQEGQAATSPLVFGSNLNAKTGDFTQFPGTQEITTMEPHPLTGEMQPVTRRIQIPFDQFNPSQRQSTARQAVEEVQRERLLQEQEASKQRAKENYEREALIREPKQGLLPRMGRGIVDSMGNDPYANREPFAGALQDQSETPLEDLIDALWYGKKRKNVK
jgi:hypothetical protein